MPRGNLDMPHVSIHPSNPSIQPIHPTHLSIFFISPTCTYLSTIPHLGRYCTYLSQTLPDLFSTSRSGWPLSPALIHPLKPNPNLSRRPNHLPKAVPPPPVHLVLPPAPAPPAAPATQQQRQAAEVVHHRRGVAKVVDPPRQGARIDGQRRVADEEESVGQDEAHEG